MPNIRYIPITTASIDVRLVMVSLYRMIHTVTCTFVQYTFHQKLFDGYVIKRQ